MKILNLLLALAVAGPAFLAGSYFNQETISVDNKTVNVTEQVVEVNNETVQPQVVNSFDYIQNAEHDTKTDLEGDTFKVEDIDAYGRIYGSSMAPSIMQDDKVISTKFDDQDLEHGHIIRYTNSFGTAVIHRVVGDYQRHGYVMASGDNSDRREKVNTSEITHIVKGVIYG